MTSASLENLAAYITPVQSQQPQPEGLDAENGNTPGQKRKRNTLEPQGENNTQLQQKQHQTRVQSTHPLPQPPCNSTPSPAQNLPVYEMPRFNEPNLHYSPPSPTHKALKRRKLLNSAQNTHEADQREEMEVHEEVNQETDQGDTPTAANKKRQQEKAPNERANPPQNRGEDSGEKEMNTSVEVDELANARTLARVLTMADKHPMGSSTRDPIDPLDKYTKGPMPKIYDEDPATLLARIDPAQIGSWLALPTGKVLAHPFDYEVRYKPNHQKLAQELAAAAKEITGATAVAVAPPNRDTTLPQRGHCPYTFLIHNISKEDEEKLLEREVWSSKEITFQVATIYIKRPEFLFTLKGFSTTETIDVLASLAETWEDPVTTSLIRTLASHALSQAETQEWNNQMTEFLRFATVEHLDIRSQGGRENPHFNVYANGDTIVDDEAWVQLRKYLQNRMYRSMTIGTGRVLQEDFVCGLCHGHDHPRGLCPFPNVPGWNGGGRFPKRPETPEPFGTYLPAPANNTFRGHTRGRRRGRGLSHGLTHPRGTF